MTDDNLCLPLLRDTESRSRADWSAVALTASAASNILLSVAVVLATLAITGGQAKYTEQLQRQTDRLQVDALMLKDLSRRIDWQPIPKQDQAVIEQPDHSPDSGGTPASDDPFEELNHAKPVK